MNLLFANDHGGTYPASYFAATASALAPLAPLRESRRADVVVIGAGYTGLSAALHLAQRGQDVVVLEAHRVGFGASGRNGGQVGTGQRIDQDALERMVGRTAARALWDMGQDAGALVRQLIARHAIDCALTPGVLHAERHPAGVRAGHAYAARLRRDYGYDLLEPLEAAALRQIVRSPDYAGGVLDHGAGHLHPLRYALGLARAALAAGAVIHEDTLVTRVIDGPRPRVETALHAIEADHVILAANGYLGGLNSQVAAKVMPINNFIIATEPLEPDMVLTRNLAVADSRFIVNYFRLSEDHRLLFGGGESYGYRFPDIAATVRKPMLKVFPQLAKARIDYAWGGTLAITRTRLPYFARPGRAILSASGYSGHGVALATLAGRAMAEAVAGQSEQFDLMAGLKLPSFPGGASLRRPLLVLAMSWFALRDRLGF